MTWDSGPALPPGTVVLAPEQAVALRDALTGVGRAFEQFAAAWAELSRVRARVALPPEWPRVPTLDETSEVHLRVFPGGGDRP